MALSVALRLVEGCLMGSPKDVRGWSARERKAHYQEQANNLREMAVAQPGN